MAAVLLPLLLSTLLSFAPAPALAGPCVEFDTNFNLYVFGLNGKDVNLGAQSTWSNPSPQGIATSGRPPFDGTNTQCFLSQYNNAIYVLGGDNANPANIYIYDATGNAWSMSQITTAGVDPNSLVAILDHDTNVFFALSNGTLYQLDFGEVKATSLGPSAWTDIEAPSFSTTGYNPVMAIAQNHIHFLDVPGNSAGQANIFVIHFGYFQPEVQNYPVNGTGSTFPEAHGQATSFFDPNNNVQQQFAFIPDGNAATYIVNVENNSTIPLVGPTDKTNSTFAASDAALVQLTSAGSVYWMPFDQNNPGAATNWTHISGFGTAATATSSSSSMSASVTGAAATSTGAGRTGTNPSGTSASAAASATSTAKSGAMGRAQDVAWGTAVAALVMGMLACVLV